MTGSHNEVRAVCIHYKRRRLHYTDHHGDLIEVQFSPDRKTVQLWYFCVVLAVAQDHCNVSDNASDWRGADQAFRERTRVALNWDVDESSLYGAYWVHLRHGKDVKSPKRATISRNGVEAKGKNVAKELFVKHRRCLRLGPRNETANEQPFWTIVFEDEPPEALKRLALECMFGGPSPGKEVTHSTVQVPDPVADLFGRDPILDAAEHLVRHERRRVLVFHGFGGIGKTQLAFAVVSRLRDLCSQYRLFVDLRGSAPAPDDCLSPTDAMRQVITLLDPAWKATDEVDIPGEFTSHLDELRQRSQWLLLGLDDARDRKQAEAIVERVTDNCLVLLTSRTTFSLPGNGDFPVTRLEREDSIELFHRNCGWLGVDHADRIADQCGDFPLALRLTSSYLAARPDTDAEAYIEDLERLGLALLDDSEEASERKIGMICELSLRRICEQDERFGERWLMLSVFQAPFDAEAAAAIWNEVDLGVARGDLSELLRFNMIEWRLDERKYQLHALVRHFAASRIMDRMADRRRRHAAHYLESLKHASVIHDDEGILDGLRLYDADASHIRDAFEWCAAHLDDPECASMCEQFARSGTSLLHLRQGIEERLRWREVALKAAEALGDHAAQSHHAAHLCRALDRQAKTPEEFQAAIRYGDRAVGAARIAQSILHESEALNHRGNACRHLGDKLIRKATKGNDANGPDTRNTETMGEFIGGTFEGIRWLIQAMSDHGSHLSLLQRLHEADGNESQPSPSAINNLRKGQGRAWGLIGNAIDRLRMPELGEQIHRVSLGIGEQCANNDRNIAVACGNLAQSIIAQGAERADEAITFLRRRLDVRLRIGDRRGEAITRYDLGVVFKKLGRRDEAREELQQAIHIFEAEGDHARRDKGRDLLDGMC